MMNDPYKYIFLNSSIKYVGFFSCCLAIAIVGRDYWRILGDRRFTNASVLCQLLCRALILTAIPTTIYLSIFYAHLSVLSRAGPHDSVMTSAFQASLEVSIQSTTVTGYNICRQGEKFSA